VFYERDYLNLLVKYGLEQPAQKTLVRAPRTRRAAAGDAQGAAAADASPGEGDVSSAL
jgi:hypothetical protein